MLPTPHESLAPVKRKRTDDASPRRVKASPDTDRSACTSPPSKGPYDDLGFDPFAPHPGMTKEERKMARMIRNRNAAQASRDRKKEHVVELEQRVQELEAQLTRLNGAPLPALSPPCPFTAAEPLGRRSPSPAPSHDSTSTISPTQAESLSQARIASLEEENERLRDRLEAESRRSDEYKGRLEAVEKRFEGLERLLGALMAASSPQQSTSPSAAPATSPPTTDPIDWSSLLATPATHTQATFEAPEAPLHPPVPSSGVEANTDPTPCTVMIHPSNRLVAREVSLPRTLVSNLTAQRDRVPLLRRRLPPPKTCTGWTSRGWAWRVQRGLWSALTVRRVPSLTRLNNGRCKKTNLGLGGLQKRRLVLVRKKD